MITGINPAGHINSAVFINSRRTSNPFPGIKMPGFGPIRVDGIKDPHVGIAVAHVYFAVRPDGRGQVSVVHKIFQQQEMPFQAAVGVYCVKVGFPGGKVIRNMLTFGSVINGAVDTYH